MEDDEIPSPPVSKFELICSLMDVCSEKELQTIHDVLSAQLQNSDVSEVKIKLSDLSINLLEELGIVFVNKIMVSRSATRKDIQSILCAINGRLKYPHFWQKLNCELQPAPRSIHASAVFKNSQVLVHGGICDRRCEDIFSIDPQTKLWSIIKPREGSRIPKSRWSHSMTILGSTVFLFGGVDHKYFHSEILRFDLQKRKWRKEVSIDGIGPRHGSSMCVFKDRYLVVFGGAVNSTDGYKYVNDLYMLDCEGGKIRKKCWKKKMLELEEGDMETLCPRAWHSVAIIDENRMLVYGGSNRRRIFNDLHVVNLFTGVVKNILTTGSTPPKKIFRNERTGYRIYDSSGKMVFRSNFLFVYGFQGPRDANPELYRLDWKTKVWEKIKCKNRPLYKNHPSVNLVGDKLVLFGGSNISRSSDTWLMTLHINRDENYKNELVDRRKKVEFVDCFIRFREL